MATIILVGSEFQLRDMFVDELPVKPKVCKWCVVIGPAVLLDENGTLTEISKKPGRWSNPSGDGWGKCDSPPGPDDPPYLFATELVEMGLANFCDDEECEPDSAPLIVDGQCIWCGKEYPNDISVKPENPNQESLGI